MARISIEDLEHMTQTNFVCTQKIKLSDPIFGDDAAHILEFDIFDGFAYCSNYKGKEYYMTFPRTSFMDLAKGMKDEVISHLSLPKGAKIGEKELLATYNELYINE